MLGLVVSVKRTQHCWPTTPNIVRCYMLRPFAHLVACCCAKFETGQTFSFVQTDATTPINVGSCWPTMFRPFAWGFRHKTVQTKEPWKRTKHFWPATPSIDGTCYVVWSWVNHTWELLHWRISLFCDSRLSLKSWYSWKRYTVDIQFFSICVILRNSSSS